MQQLGLTQSQNSFVYFKRGRKTRHRNLKGHFDSEILFPKCKQILENRKIALQSKNRMLNCYFISVLLYSSRCWTILLQMEMRIETTEMQIYRRNLRIVWTEHMSKNKVLEKIKTKNRKIENRNLNDTHAQQQKGNVERSLAHNEE